MKKAKESLAYVSHLMELEDQKVEPTEQEWHLESKKQSLRSGKLSRIWD